MAKTETQKLKILYLKQLLEEQTDEQHPLSVPEMIEYLASLGIPAERKSIYRDLANLQAFGLDVVRSGNKYFLGSRAFELPELKLLVDAVQSSRFLSVRKSVQLIEKLSQLVSVHQAEALKGQVMVLDRVKNMNESVYYSVDRIHEAISANSQITFHYCEWGVDGQRHNRPGLYVASPYALIWSDDNYYLVAHSQRHGITHYRVDKMADITATGKARTVTGEAKELQASAYGKNVFGMFGGETVQVRMRFHNSLAGVVLDRFGPETTLIPDGPEHFVFTMDIAVSPLFLGWLAGFGDRAKILSPQSVIDAYAALIQPSVEQYGE